MSQGYMLLKNEDLQDARFRRQQLLLLPVGVAME